MARFLVRFLASTSGATAIEYSLIAALIAIVVISGLTAIGSNLNTKFGSVASNVASAGAGG